MYLVSRGAGTNYEMDSDAIFDSLNSKTLVIFEDLSGKDETLLSYWGIHSLTQQLLQLNITRILKLPHCQLTNERKRKELLHS